MMKFCEKLTRQYDIPTVASLNALMVDGTGMCGACRVTVGGKTRFTCVDGPEFDAHLIDFDEILSRLGGFKDAEVAKLHDVEVKQEEAEHSHGVSDRNEPWRQELRQ